MAKRPRGRSPRPSARRTRKGSRRAGGRARWRRPSARILLGLGLLAAVGATAYLAWLDLQVTSLFETRRASAAARVFARPLELYAGLALSEAALVAELEQAGYRPAARADRPGRYTRSGARFEVHTRDFEHWDGREPGRRLLVELADGRVRALREGAREVVLARLEPALIGLLYPAHGEDRIPVRLDEAPPLLVAGLLAVEDRRFHEHFGISPRAIARAALANLRAGRVVQGASTITQQLARNLFLGREQTLARKLNEALMAILLERHYGKREILEAYLNEVFLGQDGARAIHGFGLASHFYFGRPLAELELEETALLVALVRGASFYNPRRHPERARARRDRVLETMAQQGAVREAAARRAQTRPLGVLAEPPPSVSPYPAFLDLVRRQLRRDYPETALREVGLRVYTTLDPAVQAAAERSLSEGVDRLERAAGLPPGSLQGAAVVTDASSGEVLAVVGDRAPRRHGFNRALDALRPVGSLAKPAVYLAALEDPDRYSLATLLDDRPLTVADTHGEPWRPRNYDGEAHGRVPLREALARSYNLATVRLGLALGLERVAGAIERLGVERPLERYPSMTLGAFELAPIEVAGAYQTIAAGGFRTPQRSIREVTDPRGERLARYPLRVEQAFAPGPVFLLTRALVAAVREGTARSVYQVLPRGVALAGKTGTTDDLRDSWFAGFDARRLAVVWLGRDDNEPIGLSGARGAAQVWAALFAAIGPRSLENDAPPGIEWRWTDLAGGRVTGADCSGAVRLPYLAGSAPPGGGCAGRAEAGVPAPVGLRVEEDRR